MDLSEDVVERNKMPEKGSVTLVANPHYKPGRYYKNRTMEQLGKDSSTCSSPFEANIKPEVENVEGTSDDEEEDIEEDELYLRLIALKSMAPDLVEEESNEKNDTLETEMNELLEEADKAAETAKNDPPLVDVPDSDEEEMDAFMKRFISKKKSDGSNNPDMPKLLRKLKNSLARQRRLEEQEVKTEYSPTQSPIPDHDLPSQVDSASSPALSEESVPTLSPASPPLEEIPVPGKAMINPVPPRLPPPAQPAPPEKVQDNVPMAMVLAKIPNAEPLPPGDEASFNQRPPGPPPKIERLLSNSEPVDMELGSENEAEIQFFKEQREEPLFPPSVWQFGNSNIKMKDVLTFSNDQERYEAFLQAVVNSNYPENTVQSGQLQQRRDKRKRRKRKSSIVSRGSKSETSTEHAVIAKPSDNVEDENEEEMRANLIFSLLRKRAEKKKTNPKTDSPQSPTEIKIEKNTKINAVKQAVKPIQSNFGLVKEIQRHPKELQAFKKSLHLEQLQNLDVLKLKKSVQMQRKYFPNLVKQCVIRLDYQSSEEDEENEPPVKISKTFSNDLDQFLKSSRSEVEARKNNVVVKKVPTKPLPKPFEKTLIKILPNKSQLTKNNKLVSKQPSPLTKSMKSNLLKSDHLQHLPPEKQLEYKKLMMQMRKLQKAKEIKAKQTAAKKIQSSTEVKEDNKETLNETEKQMRQRLLDNIQKKKQEHLNMKDLVQDNIENPVTSVNVEKQKSLKDLERNVISKRKVLIDKLFKLSAQISSLTDAGTKLETAESFVEDLKQQLKEAEQIIIKKKDRINNLREVVVNSHKQITEQKDDIRNSESECRKLGLEILGEKYKLPIDCNQTIKNKLNSIANNTKKIQSKGILQNSPEDNKQKENKASLPEKTEDNKTDNAKQKTFAPFKKLSESALKEAPPPIIQLAQQKDVVSLKKSSESSLKEAPPPPMISNPTLDQASVKSAPPPPVISDSMDEVNKIKSLTDRRLSLNRSNMRFSAVKNNSNGNRSTSNKSKIVNSSSRGSPGKSKISNIKSSVDAANSDSKSSNPSVSLAKIQTSSQPQTDPLKSISSASLAHLKVRSKSQDWDPHKEICRFDLLGKCNDEQCQYQHLKK